MSVWWQQLKQRVLAVPANGDGPDARLAMAVLLHEVAHADAEQAPLEIETVGREIAQTFGLDTAAAERLRAQAAMTAERTVSLHDMVAALNRSLDADGRRALIASLWRVAYADGQLDPQEEGLIRRLADLLHVPHSVFLQERLKAAQG